jgi:SAM-dependent methyltransferase
MYIQSAHLYDVLYNFKDYQKEYEYIRFLLEQKKPNARSLLDVGCGTGKHLDRLRAHYRVEGLDLNPELLKIARARHPEVPFHQADMVNFDLASCFDVITCLFSSIGYVKTVENLQRAIANFARHLSPRGLLLVEPWFTLENYWTGRVTANYVDEPELKISWMYTSDPPQDGVSVLNIHYLVGTPQRIQHFTERHEIGLFTHEEYVGAFASAGLTIQHDPRGPMGRGLFIGTQADPR